MTVDVWHGIGLNSAGDGGGGDDDSLDRLCSPQTGKSCKYH